MKTKEQILNNRVMLGKLRQDKPMLVHNILRAMEQYKNQELKRAGAQRDELLEMLNIIINESRKRISEYNQKGLFQYLDKADGLIKSITKRND